MASVASELHLTRPCLRLRDRDTGVAERGIEDAGFGQAGTLQSDPCRLAITR